MIEAYARREGLTVTTWYEERETAAHVGRTHFRSMLRDLRQGHLHGLILHKIDRGARNLSDWAALSELADSGVDVRIAGDTLDLGSRGGRLSADIQAVVAADYIRNLREEVKKGQRGRLRQGMYPWAAPLGYLDTGGGKAKAIDPIKGPLVRRAFEAYATGEYSLRTLRVALATWGLTKSNGQPLSVNVLNDLLRRPFYYGLIEVGGTAYAGAHEPLISKDLFDRVAAVLSGRVVPRSYGRTYVFRQAIECGTCHRHLYAETQKGHVYYRCHTDGCQGTCVRETEVLEDFLSALGRFPITEEVIAEFKALVADMRQRLIGTDEAAQNAAKLRLGQLEERASRLADTFLDGVFNRDTYESRQRALEIERLQLTEQIARPTTASERFMVRAEKCLELLKSLKNLDQMAEPTELREVVKATVSNCLAHRKYVEFAWFSEARALVAEEPVLVGAPVQDAHRTPIQLGRTGHPFTDQVVTDRLVHLVALLAEEAKESDSVG